MEIKTVAEFDKALAYGPYAWPGGYPMFFVTEDGGVLSFSAAIEEADLIRSAIAENDTHGGWRVCAVEINYEENDLYCDHTGQQIGSAYGE